MRGSWSGSYINIGLICDKKDFKEKVVKLMQSLEGFCCKRIDYPVDENYSDWVEVPWEQSGIEAAIDHCIKCNMAKITGDFKLGGYEIKDALFQVESLPDNLSCFYIEMPEQQNQIFKNLDVAEEVIISFLKELSSLEFSKGFCDSEAVAGHESGYAISVDYEPSVNMILQSWKIDGLTGRV